MVRWRGSRLPRRRQGGSVGGALPPWMQLGPHFSYVADPAYLVLATGVERWADELDPANVAKDLAQLALANQPAFVPVSVAPSGCPTVRTDGVSQYLEAPRTLGYGAGTVTAYEAYVRRTTVGTLVGEGGAGATDFARHRASGGADQLQIGAPFIDSGGAQAIGDAYWLEVTYDGTTGEVLDSQGAGVSGALAPVATSNIAMGARVTGGAPGQLGSYELAWWFGYPRILDAGERLVGRAAAAAKVGV